MTTPKEAYEARKAERKAQLEKADTQNEEREIEMVDFVDRFVTAVERIADALEVRDPNSSYWDRNHT